MLEMMASVGSGLIALPEFRYEAAGRSKVGNDIGRVSWSNALVELPSSPSDTVRSRGEVRKLEMMAAVE
jgi:hypothetical protein